MGDISDQAACSRQSGIWLADEGWCSATGFVKVPTMLATRAGEKANCVSAELNICHSVT